MNIKTFQDIKKKHEDAILLFRNGALYEAYDTDASIISSVLGITIDKDNDINKAGFSTTLLDTYLPKLMKAGKRVAIVDEAHKNKQQADAAIVDELTKIKRENKHLKECVAEFSLERDQALEESQKGIHELCSKLITLCELPEEVEQLIYSYIGIKEVVRIKLENKLTPSLSEMKALLDKVDELEKEVK